MRNQQQQSLGITLREGRILAEVTVFLGGLSLVPFTRRNIGYHVLNPGRILLAFVAMLLVGAFAGEKPSAGLLFLYAFLFLIKAACDRSRARRALERGPTVHSYYLGDSRLERLTARDKRSQKAAARSLDGFVSLLIGLVICDPCPVFGGWLIFAGISLIILEAMLSQRAFERDCDVNDGLHEAGLQGQAVAHFSRADTDQLSNTTTLSTGLSPEVVRNIQSRGGKISSPLKQPRSRVSRVLAWIFRRGR